MLSASSRTSTSAATMSTSDGEPASLPSSIPAGGADFAAAASLEKEIQRLASAFFGGSAPESGLSGAPPAVSSLPALTLPPVPGPLKAAPLATAPPPKEADLRAIPTLMSENFGTP